MIMQSSVLIAYATRSGSTAEVADAVAVGMQESGVAAEVLPVHQINSLVGREALVLGAPLYIGHFPKEFHQFLRLHRDALHGMRPWLFVVGPTRNQSKDFEDARRQAEKQLASYPWLHPAELRIFGGRWSMQELPFPFSLMRRIPGNPLSKVPAEDIRDWAAIREWSMGIARRIRPAA
jgi:menaquinone-dependent protoporphyrinogen oxidase